MNTYFAHVKIPPTKSLIDTNDLMKRAVPGTYNVFDTSVLSDQAVCFFKDLKVRPKHIILFITDEEKSAKQVWTRRVIHSDIEMDAKDQWRTVHCAINWEENPRTKADFHWFDTKDLPQVFPPGTPNDPLYRVQNGIHYGSRNQRGLADKVEILETVRITGPTLVRIDVPHTVSYDTLLPRETYSFAKKAKSSNAFSFSQRIAVSIRFDEVNWNSWEKCLHAFRSIIVPTADQA
jgi:hypothetical protein